MIKRTALFAVLMLAVMFSYGCQTAQSPSGGTTSIPMDSAASAVGRLAMASCSSLTTTSPAGISSSGIKTKTASHTFDSDGWLSYSYSYSDPGTGSFSLDMKSKMFGEVTGAITSEAKIDEFSSIGDTLEAIFQYSILEYDLVSPEVMSFTITIGSSKSDPLKIEAMNTTSPTITGPASYSGSYGAESFSVSMNYDAMTVNYSTDYPVGTVSFTVTSGTATAYSGTITYNGTSTATIVFTGGGSYTVDLTTGEVS